LGLWLGEVLELLRRSERKYREKSEPLFGGEPAVVCLSGDCPHREPDALPKGRREAAVLDREMKMVVLLRARRAEEWKRRRGEEGTRPPRMVR
jgi:hypothetical protein